MTHELEFTFADAPWLLALGFAIGLLTYLPDGVRVMKRLILSLLLVAAVAIPIHAQQYRATISLTIAGTSVGFDSGTVDGVACTNYACILQGSGHPQANTASCVLTAASGAVNFRVDGITVTASGGEELSGGGSLYLNDINALLGARFIRTTSTSGTLVCTLSS